MAVSRPRCAWAKLTNPLYVVYHDREWGVPSHDDRHLFEMLTLEGAQAGLSWETILNRRESYRRAFANFDPRRIAKFDAARRRELMTDPGIIRNQLKIDSTVTNAEAFVAVQREFGTFDAWVWTFVGGAPLQTQREKMSDIPAESDESRALSSAMKKRGFGFVGPTIMYAFMQAVGMVNDHVIGCFRHAPLAKAPDGGRG
jgi:DNA-3-methyladenine glycosylase I